MRALYRAAFATAAAVGLVAVPTTAGATPSSGVVGKIIWEKTIDGKDYIYRQITIQPGGTTGWHYHLGTLYGFVEQGTLTHSDHMCETDGVYKAGQTLSEPAGSEHVHLGRNLGTVPVVLDVLYVDPAGAPLAVDAPNPGCSFQ